MPGCLSSWEQPDWLVHCCWGNMDSCSSCKSCCSSEIRDQLTSWGKGSWNPIIYRVSAPSQVVVWDFSHQQYDLCIISWVWVPPSQDSSDHQNYSLFRLGVSYKPSFATGILGGGYPHRNHIHETPKSWLFQWLFLVPLKGGIGSI